jgi:uncharacterized protein YlzI (FlbEa/FlbD family)
MAQRVAGIAFLKRNGEQLPLRGNFTVHVTVTERTGIAGQDGIHGFSENPRVPAIEGDVTLTADISIEDLQTSNEDTVTAELANGKTYVLREAWLAGLQELNTGEGMVRLRWEGMSIDEF